MPKKIDIEIQLIKHQNDLLKKVIKRQKLLIDDQRKEIIRLNKKFILYFGFHDVSTDCDTDWEETSDDSSDADMPTTNKI